MIEILNILLQIFIFLIIFSFPFTERSLNNTLKLRNIKLELIDSHVINIIIFSYLCLIVSFLDIDLIEKFSSSLLLSLNLSLKYKSTPKIIVVQAITSIFLILSMMLVCISKNPTINTGTEEIKILKNNSLF